MVLGNQRFIRKAHVGEPVSYHGGKVFLKVLSKLVFSTVQWLSWSIWYCKCFLWFRFGSYFSVTKSLIPIFLFIHNHYISDPSYGMPKLVRNNSLSHPCVLCQKDIGNITVLGQMKYKCINSIINVTSSVGSTFWKNPFPQNCNFLPRNLH